MSPRNTTISLGEKDWDAKALPDSKIQSVEGPTKRLTKKQLKKLKLAVGVYCVMAALFSVLVAFLMPQSHDWAGLDGNDEQASVFHLFKPSSYLMPSLDLRSFSSSRYVIAEIQGEAPAEMMLLAGSQSSSFSTVDAGIPARRERVVSKRPIAANLLYHH